MTQAQEILIEAANLFESGREKWVGKFDGFRPTSCHCIWSLPARLAESSPATNKEIKSRLANTIGVELESFSDGHTYASPIWEWNDSLSEDSLPLIVATLRKAAE